MAAAAPSGVSLLSPSPRGLKVQGNQGSAWRLQGTVNCKVEERSRSSGQNSSSAVGRRGRHLVSPSRLVVNVGASDRVSELKATAGAEPSEDSTEGEHGGDDATIQQALLHRRQLLWGATGTFSYLTSAGLGLADPVPPSDMSLESCQEIPDQQHKLNCCLPDGSQLTPIDFEFEALPMRTRQRAHILSKDPNYIAKYNEAYARMKNLPDDDPRSFTAQWHIHCAFCEGAYFEPNNPHKIKLQYHGSWTFLPWHRMYLYFHERILGDLIGDPDFALPLWNWDNQRDADGGNQMPHMFTPFVFGRSPSLFPPDFEPTELSKAIRNPEHYPPEHVRLDRDNYYNDMGKVFDSNLALMHRAVVTPVSSTDFLGKPYRAGQTQDTKGPGSIEVNGHNIVHVWTGSNYLKFNPDNEDMGTFLYAARDPIFYSHHSNVDRMWTVWKSLPDSSDQSTRSASRSREESNDPDFLNTKFAFYNHKKQLVHVKISQTLNTEDLCYKYELLDSDNDWINYSFTDSGQEKPSPEDIARLVTDKVLKKDKSASFQLQRTEPTPSHGRSADEVEETLLIKGVKVPKNSFMLYKVFINLPDAGVSTPLGIHNFVGVITHLPHKGAHASDHHQKVDFRLSIGASLKGLGITEPELVSVTFVPGGQEEDAEFDGVEVEFN
ncbi:hypothetical protein Mapa_009664 [Marchantia paleacea]|nr:hypothetical protein Mapa_009664 [Marchantia paleacea]